ncbi:unnamed protein product [Mesocestoides corti]|uniref:Nucleolar GTP-binding protein 1 n=2 Tax=Mesocestoides corti TaxID=53468 RepID=A0A0R3U8Z3_MESCO|nr:unnamed protein product [Mesocestoides corti]
MPGYNFKSVTVVPSSKEFIDIVLSKTQRKTPTVIHKQYAMPRIRNFYMRKVKTCQQFFHDKLNAIVTEFPMVENIHPFYADLINVLYSKDHYKLALGQINTAKNIIDGIARDQVKMLKYGDSLYQCKTLKRTAFGRMCTVIKRQANNLKFLEDTRQHLSRLPSIDPDTRTLIVCGFPNVGKSSFINKITRADVDVQPFPFTTKSLFVGHTDYKNLRWQVIDTPGVLDRPLDEHNTIEMVAITALAHLQAAIIYIMDLSEQCGYSIQQQLSLFKSLRPLFNNKPLLIVANKTDVKNLASISDEDRELITSVCRMPGDESGPGGDEERPLFLEMSTLLGEGVMEVRSRACDDLLARRIEAKLRAGAASLRDGSIANRLYIARPKVAAADRPPNIPESVLEKRKLKRAAPDDSETSAMDVDGQPPPAKRPMTMRDRELAEGDDFYLNLRDHWLLKNPHERNDVIPEIFDGHNVIDFFDEDIEARLNELEEQERALEEAGFYEEEEDPDDAHPEMQELRATAKKIREARALRILESQARKKKEKGRISRADKGVSGKQMKSELGKLGLPLDISAEVGRSRSRKASAVERAKTPDPSHVAAVERSQRPRSRLGVRDEAMHKEAMQRSRLAARKFAAKSRKGEADRHIPDLKPKHLFSGKRSIGKTERR